MAKKPTPNKLSKTGKTSGIQLTEAQLDKASGGMAAVKTALKFKGG